MSLRVLLKDHPQRTIAIATDTHALVFRHSPSNTGDGGSYSSLKIPPKSMVEFCDLKAIDISPYRNLYPSGAHGTLGLININTDIFLCVISKAVRVATVRPGENVQRIQAVEFCMYFNWYPQVDASFG
jgi:synaptojanin